MRTQKKASFKIFVSLFNVLSSFVEKFSPRKRRLELLAKVERLADTFDLPGQAPFVCVKDSSNGVYKRT